MKTKDGKYFRYITMLKQLSINVLFIVVSDPMSGDAMFLKDMVTKQTSVSFDDDN